MYIQPLRRKVCAAAGSDEILHEHLNRLVKFLVDIKQPTDVARGVLQGLDTHEDKPPDTSSDRWRADVKMRRTVVRFSTIERQSKQAGPRRFGAAVCSEDDRVAVGVVPVTALH